MAPKDWKRSDRKLKLEQTRNPYVRSERACVGGQAAREHFRLLYNRDMSSKAIRLTEAVKAAG